MDEALEAIPTGDEATYQLMAEGNTLGCFQLESPGMRGLLKWLRPHNMEGVAAAISLFRPGPLEGGFLEIFMRRHLGQEPVNYHHPAMEPILRETYGVILYQEQFLRLAHELAGLSLGDAEKLRKALGKAKDGDERVRLGKDFVAGAIERGIPQVQAEKVWEIVSGYTGFGFCKAHAYSYAPTAYRSAYMKAHYPAHYMAAMLNNGGGYYGPTVYVEDARRFGIKMLPPHVNYSGAMCSVPNGERAIRLGLQFVKGLSEGTIAQIGAARARNGEFRALPDLLSRVEIRPNEAEALVLSGACDALEAHGEWEIGGWGEEAELRPRRHLNRKEMLWLLPRMYSVRRSKLGATRHTPQSAGANGSEGNAPVQIMSWGLLDEAGVRVLGDALISEVPVLEAETPEEKLALEREGLGFTVSQNEAVLWGKGLPDRRVIPSGSLARYAERRVWVAGVVVVGHAHTCTNGAKMLFLTLQDGEGLIEVVLFPETYRALREIIEANGRGPYLVRGTVQVSGKGRGIGIQPPPDMIQREINPRSTDAIVVKMHPVLVGEGMELLEVGQSARVVEEALVS
jgi:DNA polymerase III alpha subunit